MNSLRVDLPFEPRPHQRAAHTARKRFTVLVWHRRAGKTVFAVLELLLDALTGRTEAAKYGYIAPLLKQAKGVAWDYLKRFSAPIPGCTVNESELSVKLPNGAKVQLFGADNPDAMRGIYFDGVVMDEVADMKPQVWGEIIRPALTDREGWALFIGTPKGVNLFSELYYRALGEPGWHADLRRAAETGAISLEELEQAKREMTPAQYAQEMECDFAAAVDNALLRLDDVLASQRKMLGEAEYMYAPKVLGVDVARYGDDRTVIFPRQGLAAMRPRVLRGLDTQEVAAQVAEVIAKWQPDATFIDQGSMGAGVLDRLRHLGYAVIGVDFGSRALDARFENKRVEMWWQMAAWVKDGGCLPAIDGLAGELTAPTYTYANARGRLQLESKDDMRARGLPSPDIADALALTFAFPVAPRAAQTAAGGNQRRVLTDYDPYTEAR